MKIVVLYLSVGCQIVFRIGRGTLARQIHSKVCCVAGDAAVRIFA